METWALGLTLPFHLKSRTPPQLFGPRVHMHKYTHMETWVLGFTLPFIKSPGSPPTFFPFKAENQPTAPCALNADPPPPHISRDFRLAAGVPKMQFSFRNRFRKIVFSAAAGPSPMGGPKWGCRWIITACHRLILLRASCIAAFSLSHDDISPRQRTLARGGLWTTRLHTRICLQMHTRVRVYIFAYVCTCINIHTWRPGPWGSRFLFI